jgi:hypothetical protein
MALEFQSQSQSHPGLNPSMKALETEWCAPLFLACHLQRNVFVLPSKWPANTMKPQLCTQQQWSLNCCTKLVCLDLAMAVYTTVDFTFIYNTKQQLIKENTTIQNEILYVKLVNTLQMAHSHKTVQASPICSLLSGYHTVSMTSLLFSNVTFYL